MRVIQLCLSGIMVLVGVACSANMELNEEDDAQGQSSDPFQQCVILLDSCQLGCMTNYKPPHGDEALQCSSQCVREYNRCIKDAAPSKPQAAASIAQGQGRLWFYTSIYALDNRDHAIASFQALSDEQRQALFNALVQMNDQKKANLLQTWQDGNFVLPMLASGQNVDALGALGVQVTYHGETPRNHVAIFSRGRWIVTAVVGGGIVCLLGGCVAAAGVFAGWGLAKATITAIVGVILLLQGLGSTDDSEIKESILEQAQVFSDVPQELSSTNE